MANGTEVRSTYVYYLRCSMTDELLYVGCSVDPAGRRYVHQLRFDRPLTLNPHMQRFSDPQRALDAELKAIRAHQTLLNTQYHRGSRTREGHKSTDTHRAKISAALTGMPKSAEHCVHISEAKKGCPRRGVKLTDETKAKLRVAALVRAQNGPNNFAGKKHTEETKAKMREAKRLKREGVNRG